MDILTLLITVASGLFSFSSVAYFMKNKRFIGRRISTTIASFIVFAMGILALIKGVSITQIQFLIENMFK